MKPRSFLVLLVTLSTSFSLAAQTKSCTSYGGEIEGDHCRISKEDYDRSAVRMLPDGEDTKYISRKSVNDCVQKFAVKSDEYSHYFNLSELKKSLDCVVGAPSIVEDTFVSRCFQIPSVHLDHSYISTNSRSPIVESVEEPYLNPKCNIHPDYKPEDEKLLQCARTLGINSDRYRMISVSSNDFSSLLKCAGIEIRLFNSSLKVASITNANINVEKEGCRDLSDQDFAYEDKNFPVLEQVKAPGGFACRCLPAATHPNFDHGHNNTFAQVIKDKSGRLSCDFQVTNFLGTRVEQQALRICSIRFTGVADFPSVTMNRIDDFNKCVQDEIEIK